MDKIKCNYAVVIAIIMTIMVFVSILTQVKTIMLLTDIDAHMLRLY